ncbi:E3 SUMO-protein ligase ZBED1-like [Aphis gossypii]|uniref:E3 SUMO-protein ligase ZBED1-like n=1 Tax=Aphis gossypii TaxID=80765 RepID=UPI00215967F2|nr:E3 SUMO-protein ligase ZBED1-like [Aphis gossypii]
MIAEDLQPLSIVENSGFQNMIKLLDSRYQIPSRRSLSRTIIPEIYENVKNRVQSLLNKTNYVAITTDVWTSMNTDSFITITAHFFPTDQTRLKTIVLCTKKLESNHTGTYLAEVMTNELNIWDIYPKVIAIVTDGGANIKAAVRLMGIQHMPCIAHKLNLVVQHALYLTDDAEAGDNTYAEQLKNILKKCRGIVGYFKRSEVGNRFLIEKQKQLGHGQILKLKQDMRTRWNSSLFMMERLVKLKEPLTIVMISLNDAPNNLNSEEWNYIEDIVPLLKPFDSLTTELSAEQYPTISKVIPLIRGLQTSLNGKNPKTCLGQFVKQNLLSNISRRFESIEKQTLVPYFSRATLLDPRCKKVAFGVESNATDAEKSIISEITSLMHNAAETESEMPTGHDEENSDNLWNFLMDRVSSVQSTSTSSSSAIALMKQYMNMPYQHLNCNIVEYWRDHKSLLHPLSEIALKYIMIPATSVPSERIFSKAGQIMSARRNRLLPDNLDTLVFLNKNM